MPASLNMLIYWLCSFLVGYIEHLVLVALFLILLQAVSFEVRYLPSRFLKMI